MITRSRLDEIEDYHFAVGKLIHKGKSVEEVTELLKKRGADEASVLATLKSIDEAYEGPRRFEAGKGTRMVNVIVDTILVGVLMLLIASLLEKYGETMVFLACMLVFSCYYLLFELLLARTPGKYITGTIVVDKDWKKPNAQKVLIRTILRLFPLTLHSAVFYDKILHDKWSATYVVNQKRLATATKTTEK